MRVLVTAASRHGATRSIANDVARQPCAAGHAAYDLDPEQVHDLDGVDAVVLGSAVYGHFGGRLDTCTLSRAERARAHRLRAADGDYRNWPETRCWSTDLARQFDIPTPSQHQGMTGHDHRDSPASPHVPRPPRR